MTGLPAGSGWYPGLPDADSPRKEWCEDCGRFLGKHISREWPGDRHLVYDRFETAPGYRFDRRAEQYVPTRRSGPPLVFHMPQDIVLKCRCGALRSVYTGFELE